MRNLIFLSVIAALSSGCISAPTRSIHEVGVISQSIMEAADPALPMSGIRLRSGVEWSLYSGSGASLDVGIGGHCISDSDKPGQIVGVDTTARFTLATENTVSPYLIFSASADKFTEKWGDSTVDYGFTNTFGFGLRYKEAGSSSAIYLDYRWSHNSNGSTFHSDDFRDAFGLDKDQGSNPGFEGGIISLGYSVDF